MNTEVFSFKELTIEYRVYANETTLFINTMHYEDIKVMQSLFELLESQAVTRIDLHKFNGVRLMRLNELQLRLVTDKYPTRAIRTSENNLAVIVHWTMHRDSWNLCKALLDAFESERPGFQYLNDEPTGNTAIVFAYKERND
jgi:hypothetical protein